MVQLTGTDRQVGPVFISVLVNYKSLIVGGNSANGDHVVFIDHALVGIIFRAGVQVGAVVVPNIIGSGGRRCNLQAFRAVETLVALVTLVQDIAGQIPAAGIEAHKIGLTCHRNFLTNLLITKQRGSTDCGVGLGSRYHRDGQLHRNPFNSIAVQSAQSGFDGYLSRVHRGHNTL